MVLRVDGMGWAVSRLYRSRDRDEKYTVSTFSTGSCRSQWRAEKGAMVVKVGGGPGKTSSIYIEVDS